MEFGYWNENFSLWPLFRDNGIRPPEGAVAQPASKAAARAAASVAERRKVFMSVWFVSVAKL